MRTRPSTIRRLVAVGVSVVALPLATGAVGAGALAQSAQPLSQTDNIEHVTNLVFPSIPDRSVSWRGTDSDFLRFQIPGSTDTVDPVEPDLPPPCKRPEHAGKSDPKPCRSPEPQPQPEAGPTWTPPTPEENGGVTIPGDYAPRPGEVRNFNLMGSVSVGMFVTDITDPANPVVVSRWDCAISQADVFVFQQERGDGTVGQFAAYTQDATNGGNRNSACFQDIAAMRGTPLPNNSRGTFIADVTDPYRPRTVSFLQMHRGSHQTTVHPSGDYIYNSAAVVNTANSGVVGFIEVYKIAGLADGQEPQLIDTIELTTGLDSHDMTFNEAGTRLYSAALTHSFVINTEDPENNQIVSRIFDPAINIHHDAHAVDVATPAGNRTYLLLGDELGGATALGFCPGGGIHVYDITGPLEAAPVKVGAFFIPEIRATPVDAGGVRTCTAHVIQVLEDEGLLVMAWYNGGVRVLDYTGLAGLGPAGVSAGAGGTTVTPGIQEVGHSRFQNSSLWSAKVMDVAEDGSFYIYGGDMTRALDVWRFDPAGESGEERGTWMDAQQVSRLAAGTALQDGYTPFCLLPSED